jgi:hypothetical protein
LCTFLREAAAKEEAVAAFTAVLTIADKFRMNAADGLRRCLNPFCDKTVTGRKNRKCCDANCRLLFFRYSAKHQLEIAEDKEAKRARKASPAAAMLRPSQAIPFHSAAVRYSLLKDVKQPKTGYREADAVQTTKKNIITGEEIPVGRYGGGNTGGGSKIVVSYSAPLPSGVLPPKYRAPKESIQTISLVPFYMNTIRREKEEAKQARRREKNKVIARELHEKFLAAEAAPYVPVCTAEVNKPHGTPYKLRIDDKEKMIVIEDGDTVVATSATGQVEISTLANLNTPQPPPVHCPTTGRELPSYLDGKNENVTTVIPAVKKKRTKKAK